jgi:type IV pilus biogenesis protein PilP
MIHYSKLALALAFVGSAVALSAHAAEPSTLSATRGVATFGQLDELRSQNAILAEAVKAAEYRAKLTGSAGAIAAAATTPSKAETRAVTSRHVESAPSVVTSSTAQVQMVSGIGNELIAHIAMQNGSVVPVRVGTSVPGLGVVRSISLNEVQMTNKNQTIIISKAAESSSPTGQAQTQSPMPMMPAPFQMPASMSSASSMPLPPLPAGMTRGVR